MVVHFEAGVIFHRFVTNSTKETLRKLYRYVFTQ